MNTPKYAAFDYDKQEWIEGESGRLMRITQLKQELATLHGKNALRYAQFIGKDLNQAIEAAYKQLDILLMEENA